MQTKITPNTYTFYVVWRSQGRLVEDLFEDGHDFMLTALFQSDPVEKGLG